MSNQYYLRVRGRVLGPYDQEKLHSLAQRGQLSRMHEVSSDGVTWARATAFPELFPTSLPEKSPWSGNGGPSEASSPEAPAAEPPAKQETITADRPPQPGAQAWHYISSGVECGPVDFSNLQMLAGTGQVGPDDLVWTQNMQNWIPAKQVPGLIRAALPPAPATGTPSATDLPESLCRSAVDARGWAMFVAVTAFVYAAIQIVSGIVFLAVGSRGRSGVVIAGGIVSLVHALLICIAGALLSTYASRLGGLRYSRHPAVLERSLDSLRSFWIFLSIYLIVVLALVGVFAIYALTAGAGLPESLGGDASEH